MSRDTQLRPASPLPPTSADAPELFLLAASLARGMPDVAVHLTTAPGHREDMVLDGHVLAEDGVEVY
ncbi:MAG: hypothetical protein HY985_15225 [Magnetospirillum sp.]|nr:hypothetical protein [Magnetospirillum sp.]